MIRFFDRMEANKPMERSNWFVQTNTSLYHPSPLASTPDPTLEIGDIKIRTECQTFRRLPKTGAVLFTVRTFMTDLCELSREELANFAGTVRDMSEETRNYKGVEHWGPVALAYCDEMTSKSDME
jgi:Protein of unknown function (DUF3445)